MQAKIIDRKWVVEWFDERQCYHMPSLTLADNGNLLAVWNGGFFSSGTATPWAATPKTGCLCWSRAQKEWLEPGRRGL